MIGTHSSPRDTILSESYKELRTSSLCRRSGKGRCRGLVQGFGSRRGWLQAGVTEILWTIWPVDYCSRVILERKEKESKDRWHGLAAYCTELGGSW